MSVTAEAAGGMKTFAEVPQAGFFNTVRNLIALGGGRVDMLSTLRALYDSKGPIVGQRGGPFPLVNFFGPEGNKFVLIDKEQAFSARIPWMKIMGRIFPNGLLLQDGERHRKQRKLMNEAFTRPVLKAYSESMNPKIERGIAEWGAAGELAAFRAFKLLTLEMAGSIFIGEELGAEAPAMNRAFENMVAASMSRLQLAIPGLEFWRGLQGRRYMIEFISRRIAARREASSSDMFSRLCHARGEDGEAFDNQEIIDHMAFLMMAAHDTTTSTLTSMTYELARNTAWQERLRDDSRALGKRLADFEDLDKLEALTWTMKEALRRYPPLPVIPRVSVKPFEFGGHKFPEGVLAVVSPILTHHLEEWWPDPFKFDPERFSPARAEHERHTHAWIPFGGGAHLCLGMRFAETQVRSIMHQMLLKYRWSVPEGYAMPVQQAPISKPRDGLPVRIERIG